jgi:hypothetical protein
MQIAIPACGFTIFNVWQVPYEWWLMYVELTQRIVEKKG